jgi:hypothetical protein
MLRSWEGSSISRGKGIVMTFVKDQKNIGPQDATIDKKESKLNKFQGKHNSNAGNKPGQSEKLVKEHGSKYEKHAKLADGGKARKAEDVKAESENCVATNKDDRNIARDAESIDQIGKPGKSCN